ncbi:UDP-glycosyltransferase 73E1-like [Ananas comosus]|uniref:Glycosyltransferase n=1 Tax=Ananas comosus TaxID=4615 RepID=A0A6P5FRU9_ANACO|nr:UDP-glycosyltransferase 73E1-like [Ananas comosus]
MATKGSAPNTLPHFVLVPFMAQGHLIPAMDIAALLTARGAAVTLITTPVNSAHLRPLADRLVASSSHSGPFRLAELPFPAASFGLPEGCESLDLVPSRGLVLNLFRAAAALRGPLTSLLRSLQGPSPSCLVADICQAWTADVAADLGIPRLLNHVSSGLAVLSYLSAERHGLNGPGAAAAEPFEIPGVPHGITATRAEAPGWFCSPGWEEIKRSTLEAETTADGIILNTFELIEGDTAAAYAAMLGKPVYCIGPSCLSTKDTVGSVGRGGDAAVDAPRCVEWLAAKKPRSVIYVSFGSLTYVPPKQVIEIGEGLAAAGAPFVLVIKQTEVRPRVAWLSGHLFLDDKVAQWLSGEGGFEDRNKEKGMVIRGWAPQAVILSHPSVGGLVTHCGWNSALESVTAGLPAVCWPHFGDHFMNKKLVVDILRTGVDVGIKGSLAFMDPNGMQQVSRQEVERAVRSLMDGGEEAEERRQRAAKFAEEARKAMQEGGSSYKDLDRLMQFASQKDCNGAD